MITRDKLLLPIPTWALCYLINGDPSGLTDDEVALVDKECLDLEVICPSDYYPYFSTSPLFGSPCEVVDCDVLLYYITHDTTIN
jgi:hypothetical protein